MNINDLNKIKTVNLDQRVGEVKPDGTFKELFDAVMDNTLIPLVDNAGNILGGSFSMPAKDLVEDNINRVRFEMRYATKPLMVWFYKALELKVNPEVQVYGIKEIVENGEDGGDVKVVLNNGKELVISEVINYSNCADDDYADEEDNLPTTIYLEEDLDIDPDLPTREIRRLIKNEYGYFLARDYNLQAHVDYDDDHGWALYNVKWGRKARENELD